MTKLSCLLFLATPFFAASAANAKLVTNKLAPNKLAPNQAAASHLSAKPLATDKLAPKLYAANPATVNDLLATDDGREVLSFIVSCALPEGVTLRATALDGTVYDYNGEVGLARRWLRRKLGLAGRGWVSACLLARVNAHSVEVPVSLRGPHQALATTQQELTWWTLEEGAFYGDYFAPDPEPLVSVACRGKDQAAGETGGLVQRDCAEPAPYDPVHTRCGFTYAGDCGTFAPLPACVRLAHGSYRRCVDVSTGRRFRQVITVHALQ